MSILCDQIVCDVYVTEAAPLRAFVASFRCGIDTLHLGALVNSRRATCRCLADNES